MEKKRTRAQDAAKGLMIIAIVFFHCFLVTSPNPMEAATSFNILGAIFPFLLSSFFFYTGYNFLPKFRSVPAPKFTLPTVEIAVFPCVSKNFPVTLDKCFHLC